MVLRRALFLLAAMCIIADFAFAQGIASRQEAINYYNEGLRAQKIGDFVKARKEYSMAMMLSSEYNKLILHNKGVMFAQQGDLAQAEAAFKEVLRLDPNNLPAKLNLGLIYDRKYDKCQSIEYWADLFNLEKAKPKNFILEKEQKPAK